MRTCSPRLAKEKYCTGCMACSDACTHDAIKIVEKNCMPFVKVDTHKCMNCHLCEKACPIITPVKILIAHKSTNFHHSYTNLF